MESCEGKTIFNSHMGRTSKVYHVFPPYEGFENLKDIEKLLPSHGRYSKVKSPVKNDSPHLWWEVLDTVEYSSYNIQY